MDLAWQRKYAAQSAADRAWQRRCDMRDPMVRALKAKEAANETQQDSWQHLSGLRNHYGPRIEELKRLADRAFGEASAAYERRDGTAGQHASEGRSYAAELSQIFEELNAAKAVHKDNQAAFRRTRDDFDAANRPFKRAKEEHERLQQELKDRKAELYQARDAFMKRLREVRGARIKRNEDKRQLAERAGVPSMYHDALWISWQGDTVNIYFGGVGTPNGEGHGHYAMHISGKVTYRRDPHTLHGSHNFTDERPRPTKQASKESPFTALIDQIQGRTQPEEASPFADLRRQIEEQQAATAEEALLYTRSARSNHEPLGIDAHGGEFYRRDEEVELHITQYFDDKYHVSWDATPHGNANVHWTKQDLPDGHPDRHTPPDDATI